MSASKQKKAPDAASRLMDYSEDWSPENIDLDVYMSEYTAGGYGLYATEKVSMAEMAGKRKKVFEKSVKGKSEKSVVHKKK